MSQAFRAACRILAAMTLALSAAHPVAALDLRSLQTNNWIEVKPKWKWPEVAKGGAFQERGWGTMRYRTSAGSSSRTSSPGSRSRASPISRRNEAGPTPSIAG